MIREIKNRLGGLGKVLATVGALSLASCDEPDQPINNRPYQPKNNLSLVEALPQRDYFLNGTVKAEFGSLVNREQASQVPSYGIDLTDKDGKVYTIAFIGEPSILAALEHRIEPGQKLTIEAESRFYNPDRVNTVYTNNEIQLVKFH